MKDFSKMEGCGNIRKLARLKQEMEKSMTKPSAHMTQFGKMSLPLSASITAVHEDGTAYEEKEKEETLLFGKMSLPLSASITAVNEDGTAYEEKEKEETLLFGKMSLPLSASITAVHEDGTAYEEKEKEETLLNSRMGGKIQKVPQIESGVKVVPPDKPDQYEIDKDETQCKREQREKSLKGYNGSSHKQAEAKGKKPMSIKGNNDSTNKQGETKGEKRRPKIDKIGKKNKPNYIRIKKSKNWFFHQESFSSPYLFALAVFFGLLPNARGIETQDRERMVHEWCRLASFQHYTGRGNGLNLARNGFYCNETNAGTVCFACNLVVSDWEYFSDVAEHHRRHSPDCPMHSQTCQNVPIHRTAYHRANTRVNRVQRTAIQGSARAPQGDAPASPHNDAITQYFQRRHTVRPFVDTPGSPHNVAIRQYFQRTHSALPVPNLPGYHVYRTPTYTELGVSLRTMREADDSTVSGSNLIAQDQQLNEAARGNSRAADLPEENIVLQLTCRICNWQRADTVFLPCGHLMSCLICSVGLDRCHICGARIRRTVRTSDS